eukprot:TRINITY_DN27545_c0_g1_i1.p1 TRINITY_DN27545_c0_g1~~TRINITY_DN27545_c0_g1_i1.p1  ORF type:complete len:343 (+),score=84.99 TRINITY_DN27545_c0_g1_i1:60-1088(+)
MSLSLRAAQVRARKAVTSSERYEGRLIKPTFRAASEQLAPCVKLQAEARELLTAVPRVRALLGGASGDADDVADDFQAELQKEVTAITRNVRELTRGVVAAYSADELDSFQVSSTELVDATLDHDRRQPIAAILQSRVDPKSIELHIRITKALRKRRVPVQFMDKAEHNVRVQFARPQYDYLPSDTAAQPRPKKVAVVCPSFPPSELGSLAAVLSAHDVRTVILPEMFATAAGSHGALRTSFGTIDALEIYLSDSHAATLRAFHADGYAVIRVNPTGSSSLSPSDQRAARAPCTLFYIAGCDADRASAIPADVPFTEITTPCLKGAVALSPVALAALALTRA